MSDATPIRRRVVFSGQVQGVGFRATTAGLAHGFAVTGFVRNLPDGRVELVAEGTADQMDEFVNAVHREMDGYIAAAQASDATATGEFSGFRIAR